MKISQIRKYWCKLAAFLVLVLTVTTFAEQGRHLSSTGQRWQQQQQLDTLADLQQAVASTDARQQLMTTESNTWVSMGLGVTARENRLQQEEQQQHLPAAAARALLSTRPAMNLRKLKQYKPSSREKESSKQNARHMSGWHAFSITLLCLFSMAALGFIGYKAVQWYDRTRRPGYVELQAIDTAYHRPWVSL